MKYLFLQQKTSATFLVKFCLVRLHLDGVRPVDEGLRVVAVFHAEIKKKLNEPRANVKNKFCSSIAVQWWNEALQLGKPNKLICDNQSECLISE